MGRFQQTGIKAKFGRRFLVTAFLHQLPIVSGKLIPPPKLQPAERGIKMGCTGQSRSRIGQSLEGSCGSFKVSGPVLDLGRDKINSVAQWPSRMHRACLAQGCQCLVEVAGLGFQLRVVKQC